MSKVSIKNVFTNKFPFVAMIGFYCLVFLSFSGCNNKEKTEEPKETVYEAATKKRNNWISKKGIENRAFYNNPDDDIRLESIIRSIDLKWVLDNYNNKLLIDEYDLLDIIENDSSVCYLKIKAQQFYITVELEYSQFRFYIANCSFGESKRIMDIDWTQTNMPLLLLVNEYETEIGDVENKFYLKAKALMVYKYNE